MASKSRLGSLSAASVGCFEDNAEQSSAVAFQEKFPFQLGISPISTSTGVLIYGHED